MKPAAQDPLTVIELARILEEVGFPPGVVNLVELRRRRARRRARRLDRRGHDQLHRLDRVGITDRGGRWQDDEAPAARARAARARASSSTTPSSTPRSGASAPPGASTRDRSAPLRLGPSCSVASSTGSSKAARLRRRRSRWATPPSANTIVGPAHLGAPSGTGWRTTSPPGGPRGPSSWSVVGARRTSTAASTSTPRSSSPTTTWPWRARRSSAPSSSSPCSTTRPRAIALANDSDFGLYDYVFSGDTARAFQVAQQLRAGHVGINTAQRNHEAPFGGFKMSGVGRDGGDYGLEAYSELQSIVWTS